MKTLCIHVVPHIASHWFDVGFRLFDGQYDNLKVIKANHPNDILNCTKEMLQLWLERTVDADWNQLLEICKEIGLTAFAASIENKLLKGIITTMQLM